MNEKIEFKHEGQTLEELNKSKSEDKTGASDEEKKKEDENKGADDVAAGAGDSKPKPFHEDPDVQNFVSRQVESALNKEREQQKKDLDALRTEFTAGHKPDITAEKPPRWFGGKQDQWDEFKEWVTGITSKSGEGVIEKITKTKQEEEQAVQEATKFLNEEVTAIQGDKALNPKGLKVNPEELMKVVLENELIDTKGRWNYRAAWRIMRPTLEAAGSKPDKDRKELAGASIKNDKGSGDGAAKTFKTSDDFKKKRPW